MGQRPAAGSVTRYYDRFSIQNTDDNSRAAIEDRGNHLLAIGVGGPHNGNRKSCFPPRSGQTLLTSYFVTGILPEGVAQQGPLGYIGAGRRFCISRGGAYIHILAHFAGKKFNILSHMLFGKGHPVNYYIKAISGQGFHRPRVVTYISFERGHPLRKLFIVTATVVHIYIDSTTHRLSDTGTGNSSGSTNKKYFHLTHPSETFFIILPRLRVYSNRRIACLFRLH